MINNKLSILIILYEESYQIVNKCLEQIKDHRIIVIDNANDQSLKDKIIKDHKIYKYFLNKKNVGFSKAANQGILECDTEYLLILGADCLITNKDIRQLIFAKEKYENCFLVAPTFFDEEGRYTYNGGPLSEKAPKNVVLKNYGDVCVDSILTSTVLFKVNDIKDLGLFDENFFLYFLDEDLCRRIKKINKTIIQVYNAKVTHTHGQLKIKNKLKKMFFRHYYFDYDELYYLLKINLHEKKYNEVKKKISKYIIKMLINLLIMRIDKGIYYLAKILAFQKFKRLLK